MDLQASAGGAAGVHAETRLCAGGNARTVSRVYRPVGETIPSGQRHSSSRVGDLFSGPGSWPGWPAAVPPPDPAARRRPRSSLMIHLVQCVVIRTAYLPPCHAKYDSVELRPAPQGMARSNYAQPHQLRNPGLTALLRVTATIAASARAEPRRNTSAMGNRGKPPTPGRRQQQGLRNGVSQSRASCRPARNLERANQPRAQLSARRLSRSTIHHSTTCAPVVERLIASTTTANQVPRKLRRRTLGPGPGRAATQAEAASYRPVSVSPSSNDSGASERGPAPRRARSVMRRPSSEATPAK